MGSLPNINEVENFTECEALPYVTKIVCKLRDQNILKNESVLTELTLRLSNTYYDFLDFLEKICKNLINENFAEIANTIFKFCIESKNYECSSLENILKVLINFSDFNLEFSSYILKSSIFKTLVDFCVMDSNKTFLKDGAQNKCVCNVLTVINNIFRYSENSLVYKTDAFKNALVKYIKFNDCGDLGIISILTLSYIIGENEVHLLTEGVNVVGFLISNIGTINPSDQRSKGFSMMELLNGLRCISVNDSMKEKICQEKGVKLILNILDGEFGLEEKEVSFEILQNLFFVERIQESVKKECNIDELLERFSTSESEKIRKTCDGIKWILYGSRSSKRDSSQKCESDVMLDHKFDVFISYPRTYKEIVGRIRAEIMSSSLKVWIDDEQMFGSTIEAMARGIENSRVVIIGISKAYRESPNCRLEAEYAFKLHKPIVPVVLQYKYKPMSWLGFIVGTKMYYEFSERRDPRETLSGIVKSIQNILHQGSDDLGEVEEEIIPRESTPSKSMDENEKVRTMSKEDVARWLLGAGLSNYRKSFSDIDGSLLFYLLKLRLKAPEYFNFTMKKEFKMKVVDVLRFHRAADTLLEKV